MVTGVILILVSIVAIAVAIQTTADRRRPSRTASQGASNASGRAARPAPGDGFYSRISASSSRELFYKFKVNNYDSHRVSAMLDTKDAACIMGVKWPNYNALEPATEGEIKMWMYSPRERSPDLTLLPQLDLSSERGKLPKLKMQRPSLKSVNSMPNQRHVDRPQLHRSNSEHPGAARHPSLAAKRFNWTPAPSTSSGPAPTTESSSTSTTTVYSSQAGCLSSGDSDAKNGLTGERSSQKAPLHALPLPPIDAVSGECSNALTRGPAAEFRPSSFVSSKVSTTHAPAARTSRRERPSTPIYLLTEPFLFQHEPVQSEVQPPKVAEKASACRSTPVDPSPVASAVSQNAVPRGLRGRDHRNPGVFGSRMGSR